MEWNDTDDTDDGVLQIQVNDDTDTDTDTDTGEYR
jgi:hypothetical protein